MQEVFSKIIEELEIERTTANNTFVKYEMNVDLGRVFGLEKAVEIVKQEAQKYNNGWIPCSERLPDKEMIVWVSFTNQYVRYVKKALYSHDFNDNGNKRCFKWENGTKIKNQPVAWKPYYAPEPYHPKGE